MFQPAYGGKASDAQNHMTGRRKVPETHPKDSQAVSDTLQFCCRAAAEVVGLKSFTRDLWSSVRVIFDTCLTKDAPSDIQLQKESWLTQRLMIKMENAELVETINEADFIFRSVSCYSCLWDLLTSWISCLLWCGLHTEALFREGCALQIRSNLFISAQMDVKEDVEASQRWREE